MLGNHLDLNFLHQKAVASLPEDRKDPLALNIAALSFFPEEDADVVLLIPWWLFAGTMAITSGIYLAYHLSKP